MPIYFHETIEPVSVPGKQHEYLDTMRQVVENKEEGTNRPGSPMRNVAHWVTVWATGWWPQTVGLWEMEDWDWFANHFTENPHFEEIPQEFYEYRTRGFDRVLIPTDYTPSLDEIDERTIRAPVVHQEIVKIQPGTADEYLEALGKAGEAVGSAHEGVSLLGAYTVALRNRTEILNLWSYDAFHTYTATEENPSEFSELLRWRELAGQYEQSNLGTLFAALPWSPLS